MDQEVLIEKVTQELMRRLKEMEGSPAEPAAESKAPSGARPWLASGVWRRLSCDWPGLEYLENFDRGIPKYSDYEGIVIPELPSNQLVQASIGLKYGMESNLILGGLFAGVPVYISEQGLAWLDELKPGSPLRQHYEDCRRRLKSFGVEFFSEEAGGASAEACRAENGSAPAASGGSSAGCTVDLTDLKLLSEKEVQDACKEGCSVVLAARRAVITPLALDHIRKVGARVERAES